MVYIFIFFLASFIISLRKIKLEIAYDGEYISHNRTRMYNAFGMLLIMLGHACIFVPGVEESNKTFYFLYDRIFRILAVGSFFFFSGYGIMESIRKSGKVYINKLMNKRFPYILFILIALCLIPEIIKLSLYQMTVEQFISNLCMIIGLTVGGPWFVQITLWLYIMTWLSFVIFGTVNFKRTAIAMLALSLIFCFFLSFRRPFYWLDSILCFPTGMILSAYRADVENILRKLVISPFFFGVLCLGCGAVFSTYVWDCSETISDLLGFTGIGIDFTRNICGNISVLSMIIGVVVCLGYIELRKPNRFLLWFGGSAVIYLYLLHFIPIKGLKDLGIGHTHPDVAVIIIVVNSIILAFIAQSAVACFFRIFQKEGGQPTPSCSSSAEQTKPCSTKRLGF